MVKKERTALEAAVEGQEKETERKEGKRPFAGSSGWTAPH